MDLPYTLCSIHAKNWCERNWTKVICQLFQGEDTKSSNVSMSVQSQDESIASDMTSAFFMSNKRLDTQSPANTSALLVAMQSDNGRLFNSSTSIFFFFALSSWFKTYSTMWIAQFLIHAASVNGFLVFARFQATRIHLYGCVFVKNSNRLSCKLPPIVLPSVCGSQNVLDNCSQNCCAMYWNGISC